MMRRPSLPPEQCGQAQQHEDQRRKHEVERRGVVGPQPQKSSERDEAYADRDGGGLCQRLAQRANAAVEEQGRDGEDEHGRPAPRREEDLLGGVVVIATWKDRGGLCDEAPVNESQQPEQCQERQRRPVPAPTLGMDV